MFEYRGTLHSINNHVVPAIKGSVILESQPRLNILAGGKIWTTSQTLTCAVRSARPKLRVTDRQLMEKVSLKSLVLMHVCGSFKLVRPLNSGTPGRYLSLWFGTCCYCKSPCSRQAEPKCKSFAWVEDAGLDGCPSQCWLKGRMAGGRCGTEVFRFEWPFLRYSTVADTS